MQNNSSYAHPPHKVYIIYNINIEIVNNFVFRALPTLMALLFNAYNNITRTKNQTRVRYIKISLALNNEISDC